MIDLQLNNQNKTQININHELFLKNTHISNLELELKCIKSLETYETLKDIKPLFNNNQDCVNTFNKKNTEIIEKNNIIELLKTKVNY